VERLGSGEDKCNHDSHDFLDCHDSHHDS
jgi:hypothetical protein